MSQTQFTHGESNEPKKQPPGAAPPSDRTAPPPRPRRRRWPWIVGGLLLVLILLLVLAPTIASTAPVRSFIVGQVNKSLNGRIAIAGWSLGWASGIKVSGLKVYDDKNAEIAHVPRITTELSLLDAVRGKFNLGDTQIDVEHFVARIDDAGRSNFEKLPKDDATAPAPDDGDDTLPDVSGKVTLNISQGTIDRPGNPTVHVGKSTAILNIPNINQPIENDLRLAFRVGQDPAPGTVMASGTIDAVENNRLDLEKLLADQRVDVKEVNLSAATPFLTKQGQEMELGGMANGSIQASAKGLMGLSASGEIVVTDLLISGAALKGDKFESERLAIPLQITQTVVDANTTLIKIEKLGIEMPEATIAVSGQVTQQALQRLAQNQAPGQEGKIEITTNVPNIGAIANQLRNTLNLDKGVTIESGTYSQVSTITFLRDQMNFSQRADLTASGRREGRSIALKPIHMEAGAVVRPTGKPMPDIADIKLAVQSEFADLNGTGKSLAQLAITSTFDLEKLQRELGQFIELPADLKGNGQLALNTSGDPTQQNQPITTDLKLNLYPAGQTQQSLVDVDATAQIIPADGSVPGFEVRTLAVHDLRALQQQFGALVPALAEQKIAFESGKLAANVAGSFKDDRLELTKPLAVSMPNLTVSKEGKRVISAETVRVNLKGDLTTGEQLAANLTDLSVTTQSNLLSLSKSADRPLSISISKEGAPRGSGQLRVAADLQRLSTLAQAFAEPAPTGAEPADPLEVTSGQASLVVDIQTDQKATKLNVSEAKISQLALRRGAQTYPFDPKTPIALKLAAEIVTAGEMVESITISELSGDARVASISMPQPITITDLEGQPKASGAIAATGKLQDLTPLLAVLGGTDEMPYSGQFALNQNIRNQGETIALVGDITTKQFEVFDTPRRQQRIFAEDEVAIRNDVALDLQKQVADIKSLTVDMPTSKAVAVKLTGGVSDWEKRRAIKDIKLDLTYDLEKLWPVIKPMLAPETQEQLKDLKIAGQFTRQFVVRGSYPAVDSTSGKELQWYDSIRTLNAVGGLSVAQLETSGLAVQTLEIPLYLDKGRLAVEYAGKPRAERFPEPAVCNGGKLNIGGASVDLGQETPRLSLAKDHRLLESVSINPLLGDTIGKFVNPIFANSQRAKGLLSVTSSYCEGVALGEKLRSPESGRARIAFSIQEMEIANPLGSLMLGAIPGLSAGREADTFVGEIRNAVVTLERGRTTQDVTLALIDPTKLDQAVPAGAPTADATMPLRFQGDVNLADLSQSINVSLPTGLLNRFLRSEKDRKVFAQIFPEGVPISLKGTTIKPRVDAGNIVQKIAEGQLRGLLGGEGSEDPLGGLLEGLGKKKENDRDKK